MVARIGKDKRITVNEDVFFKICNSIKSHHYESGGIIGVDSNGAIVAFEMDTILFPRLHEYRPNIRFLNRIINTEWDESGIEFIGFVHSHLHNGELSPGDISYAKSILSANKNLDEIILGVINLENPNNEINWYSIRS